MVIEDKIICGVPDTMCPQDDCDNCQVGQNWLAEHEKQELWEDIASVAMLEAETEMKIAEEMYEAESRRVLEARHKYRAMSRYKRMPVTIPNHCPACGRNMARFVNFCSICGQRVSW